MDTHNGMKRVKHGNEKEGKKREGKKREGKKRGMSVIGRSDMIALTLKAANERPRMECFGESDSRGVLVEMENSF